MLPALLMLKTHEDGVADLEQRIEKHQDEILAGVLERGIDEGRAAADIDVEQADGACCSARCCSPTSPASPPVDAALGEHVVETMLRAYVPATLRRCPQAVDGDSRSESVVAGDPPLSREDDEQLAIPRVVPADRQPPASNCSM